MAALPSDSGAGRSAEARSSSSPLSSLNLRLLEPALTVRTRKLSRLAAAHLLTGLTTRPHPVPHVRGVITDLACVGAVAQALIGHPLAQLRLPLTQPGHSIDH